MRRGPERIEHNCSGKHAGFLALCRARRLGERRLPACGPSVPAAVLHEIARWPRSGRTSMPTGVDGCGVPTFALPLERSAHAFARLALADGGERVVRAMRGHPDLLRGPSRPTRG